MMKIRKSGRETVNERKKWTRENEKKKMKKFNRKRRKKEKTRLMSERFFQKCLFLDKS